MARDRSRDRSNRKRSRSRSRSRDRRRSRSRERRGWADPDPNSAVAQMQALAAAQAQAQLQRQMLAQQQALLGGGVTAVAAPAAMVAAAQSAMGSAAVAAAAGAGSVEARKSREIYIGNLAIGTVTIEMLTELFNAALAGMVPDPVTNPPVLTVKMDNTGRFAFVEFRTEELATTAMTLDKTELCGRQMNIGRPKGYVPGTSAATGAANDTMAAAQQVAAALMGGVTAVVLLEGLLDAAAIRSSDERQEVSEMVYEESVRCGKVLGIAVPVPGEDVAEGEPCRVYVKFAASAEAAKCKQMMDGRLFDDNKVKASHVTEVDYNRAAAGEWITPAPLPAVSALGSMPGMAGMPNLGAGLMPGLAGLPGFAGLQGLAGMTAPLAVPAMAGSIPGLGGAAGLNPLLGFPPPP
uniref:RRM domain-containing protein n=1 Tax=Tetradesmus obliquus TaxID=3088 RepID=A0A383VCI1_TETOB|eukprot:jgi/Sobl393_1/8626/SZX63277.1